MSSPTTEYNLARELIVHEELRLKRAAAIQIYNDASEELKIARHSLKSAKFNLERNKSNPTMEEEYKRSALAYTGVLFRLEEADKEAKAADTAFLANHLSVSPLPPASMYSFPEPPSTASLAPEIPPHVKKDYEAKRLHRLACSKAFGEACILFNKTASPLAVAEERVRRSPNDPKRQEILMCARAARAEAIELLEATGKASEEADLAFFGV